MIIGISGRISAGKDECGKIIQYLTSGSIESYNEWLKDNRPKPISAWQIHKFADALKDIVCILTGCTREQLEDNNFKNSKLSDDWIRYGYADGFIKKYIGDGSMGEPTMNNKQCDKERYELERKTNWQTAYLQHLTYRDLLQYLGTDLLRNQLHENVWVNTLFSKYNKTFTELDAGNHFVKNDGTSMELYYPNWLVTDVRFPNEANAIVNKGGFNIRINHEDERSRFMAIDKPEERSKYYHESETVLDNYSFNYIIDNNDTIEELIVKLKEILIKEKII